MTDRPGDLAGFYDQWADDYDASHADWRSWVREHGSLLAGELAERGVRPPSTVLDCTCGIGTQAIGLALAGYEVAGNDISTGEVARAAAEAADFGVEVRFWVADLLDPAAMAPTEHYDAVVSANSLTHFADAETLQQAIAAMAAATRPGGVVLITNRDYDAVARNRPMSTTPQISMSEGLRRVSFQLWDWDEAGDSYVMEAILLTSIGAPAGSFDSAADARWAIRSRVTRLRAWRKAEIEAAAIAVGLSDVRWTQRGAQPILTARKGS